MENQFDFEAQLDSLMGEYRAALDETASAIARRWRDVEDGLVLWGTQARRMARSAVYVAAVIGASYVRDHTRRYYAYQRKRRRGQRAALTPYRYRRAL